MEAWHPSGKHSRWYRRDFIKQMLQLGLLQHFIMATTKYIFIKKHQIEKKLFLFTVEGWQVSSQQFNSWQHRKVTCWVIKLLGICNHFYHII